MAAADQDAPPCTANLYLVDEVLSALQKAVRRSLVDECLFWTLELERSGLGALAMARFGVMCSEDVSLGHPGLPAYVLGARRRYLRALKAGGNDDAPLRELLQCAHTLGTVKKNRMPATAAVWVYEALGREAAVCAAALSEGQHGHWLLGSQPRRLQAMVDCVAACARGTDSDAAAPLTCAEFNALEGRAVMLLQSAFADEGHAYIWRALLAVKPRHAVIRDAVGALRDLVAEGGCSAERYGMLHALMLLARQHLYPPGLLRDLHADAAAVPSRGELQAKWPGRAFAMPAYALDKHTRRGGYGPGPAPGRVKGRDTRPLLHEGARYWRVDVSGWNAAEIARSHGDGVERACDDAHGAETLLTHFYTEGVVCRPAEFIPIARAWGADARRDPYRAAAQAFNLQLERAHHGRVPPGTAAKTVVQALAGLRELHLTTPVAKHPTAAENRAPDAPPAKPAGAKAKAKKKGRLQGALGGR